VPDDTDVIDIHAFSLCADHGQAASVVTLIVPDPPWAAMVWVVGAMARLQPIP
jgi:hypothetical protein